MSINRPKPRLPSDQEELKEAWKIQERKNTGLTVHCGHDFVDKDKAAFGDIVYCPRCHQFYVKARGFPWIACHKYFFNKERQFREFHATTTCYVPVEVRLTIEREEEYTLGKSIIKKKKVKHA